MHNSSQINLNVAHISTLKKQKGFIHHQPRMYPEYNQNDPLNPTKESSVSQIQIQNMDGRSSFSETLFLAF